MNDAAHIYALIEQSSIGTPTARALRESVPKEVGDEIVRRANVLRSQAPSLPVSTPGSEVVRPEPDPSSDGSGRASQRP